MKRKIGSTLPLPIGGHRLVAVRVVLKKMVHDVVRQHALAALPAAIDHLTGVMRRVLEVIVVNGMLVAIATSDQGVRRTMSGIAMTARNLRVVHDDLIVSRTAGIQRAIERRALARVVAARLVQFIRVRSVLAMGAHPITLMTARKIADTKIARAVDRSVRRSAVAIGPVVLNRRYM